MLPAQTSESQSELVEHVLPSMHAAQVPPTVDIRVLAIHYCVVAARSLTYAACTDAAAAV